MIPNLPPATTPDDRPAVSTPDDAPPAAPAPTTLSLNASALRLMHEYLADRDEPCPSCKYNLRNLRGVSCPECGWELRLRISTVEPAMTPWVFLVAALCIGAGLGIPSVIFILLGALGEMGRGDGREAFIGFAMILFSVCIPLALFAALNRRPFLRLNQETQYFLALLGCGSVSLTILIVIAILMRF